MKANNGFEKVAVGNLIASLASYPIDQRCVQFQQSSAIVWIEICPHADVGIFIEGQNLHVHGMHPVEKFRCQMFP